jgi:NADH-quinone oxidoreductase subunit C
MSDKKSLFDAVESGPQIHARAGVLDRSNVLDGTDHPSVSAIRSQFPDAVVRHEINAGDQHVVFVDPAQSFEVLSFLKDDDAQAFDFLADLTAVDFGGGEAVQVVYQLWSNAHKRPLRVKCELPHDSMSIRSVAELWHTANWLEREVLDLFGVEFRGHPDPRRIMMPDDYAEGHPLRKDFPLRGRFSRAEQTRRALNQDVHHYYHDAELDVGGDPALLVPTDEHPFPEAALPSPSPDIDDSLEPVASDEEE